MQQHFSQLIQQHFSQLIQQHFSQLIQTKQKINTLLMAYTHGFTLNLFNTF